MQHAVLVVEDDPPTLRALVATLGREGYAVSTAVDGHEALSTARTSQVDVIVLDVGLPGLDGFEVCRRLRADGKRTPILMLTARDQVSDRVEGLDAGADDYLVKPFALAELLARVRALLRRAATGDDAAPLAYDDLLIEPTLVEVRRGGRLIELTRTEYTLLELFMRHPRQVLTRRAIVDHIWGFDMDADSNALDVYISYLRKKLEAGDAPRLIHTVRGFGYILGER